MYLMKAMTKKPYVKADITLVDFSLSSGIASSCVNMANHGDSECTYTSGGLAYFAEHCDWVYDENKDLCYDVPTDDTRVFAS